MRTRALSFALLVWTAAAGCASDENARRAVVEVAGVSSRLDEVRGAGEANGRDVMRLESRMSALEAETARVERELQSANAELERLRAAATSRSVASASAAPPVVPAPAAATSR